MTSHGDYQRLGESSQAQTKLLGEFTEAEWKALQDLEDALPAVFTEAFPDDAKPLPADIWGVSIDPDEPSAKAKVVLMHFLRRRALNLEATKKALVDTLRWRANFLAKALEEEGVDETEFNKMYHISGRDVDGRPILYMVLGRDVIQRKIYADKDKYIRMKVRLIERVCAELDFETVDGYVLVTDFLHQKLGFAPRIREALANEMERIMNRHYPMIIQKWFYLGCGPAPWFLKGLLWMLRPFFPPGLHVVDFHLLPFDIPSIKAGLLPHIPASELPKAYGGEAEPEWCSGSAYQNA